MSGGLLVAGTTSDAGKSVVTAGICRWLSRQGVKVAPFKAQNMSLNSAVTADGAEIGRAQAMQAAAAGREPEVAMNPILIKPSGESTSQVVVMGRPYASVGARTYQDLKDDLSPIVAAALADLRGFKDLERYWIEIHRLENEGDRLYRDAVASLFANGIDPMVVIRWKDLFTVLERAVDATETAAHILEGIVIKNA